MPNVARRHAGKILHFFPGEDPLFFCWSKVNSQHFWLVESFIFAGDFSFHWSNHSCCWLKFIVFFLLSPPVEQFFLRFLCQGQISLCSRSPDLLAGSFVKRSPCGRGEGQIMMPQTSFLGDLLCPMQESSTNLGHSFLGFFLIASSIVGFLKA
jgi:hypothetical protein